MVTALFPGTFDPVTNGHVDIVRRASTLFYHLVIAVYDNSLKTLMFSTEKRVSMFREAVTGMERVEVKSYTGLTVNFARIIGAKVVLRGLRIGADFEYEREMALVNRTIGPDVEDAYLIASLENQFISSSRVKEIHALGGDVSQFVPTHVELQLKIQKDR